MILETVIWFPKTLSIRELLIFDSLYIRQPFNWSTHGWYNWLNWLLLRKRASERRSNTNMCRWGFLSQNILAQWIVVMRDRKCAVSHFSVVFPRHGTLRSLKTYKDILDLHWFSSQFAESSAQFRSKTVLIHNFSSLTQGYVTWQA